MTGLFLSVKTWVSCYALHSFAAIAIQSIESGQSICYQTGQFYLLPTGDNAYHLTTTSANVICQFGQRPTHCCHIVHKHVTTALDDRAVETSRGNQPLHGACARMKWSIALHDIFVNRATGGLCIARGKHGRNGVAPSGFNDLVKPEQLQNAKSMAAAGMPNSLDRVADPRAAATAFPCPCVRAPVSRLRIDATSEASPQIKAEVAALSSQLEAVGVGEVCT